MPVFNMFIVEIKMLQVLFWGPSISIDFSGIEIGINE